MPRTLRRLRDDDGGWALATALVLMTIMIGMGLALSVVLRGQGEVSAAQRERETGFNVAEAALNAQVRAVGYRGVTGRCRPVPRRARRRRRARTARRATRSRSSSRRWTPARA